MEISLFKKNVSYKDKDGAEKHATNFYLKCNDSLVPIQIKFFPDEEGQDKDYAGRRAVLNAFAETLPDTELKMQEFNLKFCLYV